MKIRNVRDKVNNIVRDSVSNRVSSRVRDRVGSSYRISINRRIIRSQITINVKEIIENRNENN